MTTHASIDLEQAGLCPGCFQQKGRVNPCPHCGYDEATPRPVHALAPGTVLNDQFIIGRVLGKPGGFGITYLALDRHLKYRVAIKEYLPRELAARATDRASVVPHTTDEAGLFRFGLDQLLGEAQTLASLDHANIVRVRQFFTANGTAYLVMDYYQGLTLGEYLDRQPGGRLPEPTALALLQPILDGLRAIHGAGLLHRDVKPANIYLARTDSGGARPILIDFGAAREAMGERSRSLSVVLTEGYAPFEQYHRRGHQGPWSDIYATAAVLYRMLTGEDPPPATERMAQDQLPSPADFGVSPTVSAAIMRALALRPEDRPQTAADFQRRLREAERGDDMALDAGWERDAPAPRAGAGRGGPPNTVAASDRESDYQAIIGTSNTEFYLARFRRFDANGGGALAGWNWPAFFFDLFWMLYRRMWGAAFGLLGIALLVGVFLSTLLSETELEGAGNLFGLAAKVLLGMCGNWLYYRRARKLIRKADEGFPSDPVGRAAFLQRRAGTSAILWWLLLIPIIGILAAIAIPSYMDYTQKARLSEVMLGTAPYKLAVAEYALARGEWPDSADGLGLPSSGAGPAWVGYAVYFGVVSATIRDGGDLDGGMILLTPSVTEGVISWTCSSPNIPQRMLPSGCRD